METGTYAQMGPGYFTLVYASIRGLNREVGEKPQFECDASIAR